MGRYHPEDVRKVSLYGTSELFGVKLGFFAGLCGAEIGFNVAEFFDFLLGFAGVDILADDHPRKTSPE